jgi:DNA mismatch endonuclease (patch repair protein)
MRANRRVSAREKAFRRALWRQGVRGYLVQTRLPGRPDVAFPALQLAVFVHGCFWHSCPTCRLPKPRANAAFWASKFAENKRRDERDEFDLREMGWDVLTVWEHEIRPDPTQRAESLAAEIARRRIGTARRG